MKLGVIGGGAWGTALAQVAASGGRETLLWAMEAEVVEAINARRENTLFLPSIALDPAIRATSDLDDLSHCDAWLVVTPAQHMRAVLEQAPACDKPMVLCAKGIEERSGKLLHEVAREACPGARIAVLSGPTFAHEVAKGLPTAVTLAADQLDLAEELRSRIALPAFRIYVSDDVTGAEIGGAVKNVLAIAAGASDGLGFGDNARAALVTRGLAECGRLSAALGGRRETLMGLAGLGDLVLTCTGDLSRNRRLGLALARGEPLPAILASLGHVAEGVQAARAAHALARHYGVDMPIVDAVHRVLYEGVVLREAVLALLAREPRAE